MLAINGQVANQQSHARPTRERLILKHLPQVRIVARRIYERVPAAVSLEDLISAGTVGLIAAIDRFDKMHNVKLSTYAEYKIRGAILDALRELDWAPRLQRKRARLIEAATTALEQQYHRPPREEELAEYLNLSMEEYHRWAAEVSGLNLASLETAVRDGSGRNQLGFLADRAATSPSQIAERSELQSRVAAAIEHMPRLEQTVLQLYYFEELTLRAISRIMDLHESRISQLKTKALARLRECLRRSPGAATPG